MMTIASLNDIYAWIVTTLQGDATLAGMGFHKVYSHLAPESAPFPYIVIQKQTGSFDFGLGNSRSFDSHWVSIKTVSKSTTVTSDGGKLARDGELRVRQLLALQHPTLSSGSTMSITENSSFESKETETGNEIFYHIGTVYKIMLSH